MASRPAEPEGLFGRSVDTHAHLRPGAMVPRIPWLPILAWPAFDLGRYLYACRLRPEDGFSGRPLAKMS
jgi:hypothetical protein